MTVLVVGCDSKPRESAAERTTPAPPTTAVATETETTPEPSGNPSEMPVAPLQSSSLAPERRNEADSALPVTYGLTHLPQKPKQAVRRVTGAEPALLTPPASDFRPADVPGQEADYAMTAALRPGATLGLAFPREEAVKPGMQLFTGITPPPRDGESRSAALDWQLVSTN